MPVNQTISPTVSGPIFSTGGFISFTSAGTIDGRLTDRFDGLLTPN